MSVIKKVVSVNQHTEQYPLLSDSEIQELATDIAENGLLDPITVTSDGVLLDGRNRLRACEIAGVEPVFTVYEGDDSEIGAFVRAKNRRRHQSTGSRAMSEALSMQLDGKRENGRWAYGSLNSKDLGNSMAEYVRLAGLVLDHAPGLAEQVVSGDLALDAAYKMAEQARDAERLKLEREERIAAEEADAKAFIQQNAPDLAEQVGEFFQTFSEARAVWEKRNREEAERLAYEKAAKEKQAREERQSLVDVFSSSIGKSLRSLGHYGGFDEPIAAMEKFEWSLLDPPRLEKAYGLDNLLNVKKFIDALIEWRKQQ